MGLIILLGTLPLFLVFLLFFLETGVAIVQAVVFTILSCMYMDEAVSLYPDLYYWSFTLHYEVKLVIYKKYGLNIKFEYIPERWPDIYYYWFFGKRKNYHYPTDDDIKFFYFTLFKKNGFLFMIVCCIVFRDCFLEFIFFLFKSAITFYLILCFIYTIFYIRKHLLLGVRILYKTPSKLYPILFIININLILNILLNNRN